MLLRIQYQKKDNRELRAHLWCSCHSKVGALGIPSNIYVNYLSLIELEVPLLKWQILDCLLSFWQEESNALRCAVWSRKRWPIILLLNFCYNFQGIKIHADCKKGEADPFSGQQSKVLIINVRCFFLRYFLGVFGMKS